MAALPLFIGLQPLSFLPRDQWDWAIIPVAIAMVLIALGVWLWKTRPINAASIAFRDGGFRLYVRRIFGGEASFEIDWAGVSEIAVFDGGMYGGRSLTIYGHRKEKTAAFSAAWTECSGSGVVDRLAASARAAGFRLEKQPLSLASVLRTRWVVRPSGV